METNIIIPLPSKKDRIKGHKYMYKNEIRYWTGKNLNCQHNKEKRRCEICDGSGLCIHNRRKTQCRDCKGGSICLHNKVRYYCKECSKTIYCIHKKRKIHCKICDGSGLCIHNRKKTQCIDCRGGNICDHNKQKSSCNICCPGSVHFCINCKYIMGEKRYISKTDTYEKLCADCFYKLYPDEKKIPTKYKRKQHYIHEKLKEKYGEDFFKYDIRVECGCSRKIPDWFVDCYNFVLNIECDENQHKRNDTSCETARLCELFLDCASRTFICIRFNPDSYKIEEKKIEGCFTFDEKNNIIVNQEEFEKRFDKLVEKIDYYLENGSKKDIECIKLFYDS